MVEQGNRKPEAQQDRSRKTEDLILKTALRILGDAGAAELTTANVSAAAGVSVGTIYRRFGNKEELLRHTQSAFLEEFQEYLYQQFSAITAQQAADPKATIMYVTRAMGMSFYLFRKPLRELLQVGVQNARIFEEGHAASVEGGKIFSEMILKHRDVIKHADPETAVDFVYRLTYAAANHRITQGPTLESTRPISWEDILVELGRANASYLLAPLEY